MRHRLNDPTIWPSPVQKGIPLKNTLSSFNPAPVPYYTFNDDLVNYIMKICYVKKYLPRSFEGTLRITSRYIQRTNRLHSLQLVSMVALMLATKFYEYYYFTVPEIHEMSNHEFTNKEPIKVESNHGKMVKQARFGTGSVYEMLICGLEILGAIMPHDKREIFYRHSINLFTLYFHMLYTKEIRKPALTKICEPKTIVCLIVNMSLIVMTQSKGDFPQIIWLRQLLGMKQRKEENKGENKGSNEDEYEQILSRVMEVILGSEMKEIKNGLKEFWIKQ